MSLCAVFVGGSVGRAYFFGGAPVFLGRVVECGMWFFLGGCFGRCRGLSVKRLVLLGLLCFVFTEAGRSAGSLTTGGHRAAEFPCISELTAGGFVFKH